MLNDGDAGALYTVKSQSLAIPSITVNERFSYLGTEGEDRYGRLIKRAHPEPIKDTKIFEQALAIIEWHGNFNIPLIGNVDIDKILNSLNVVYIKTATRSPPNAVLDLSTRTIYVFSNVRPAHIHPFLLARMLVNQTAHYVLSQKEGISEEDRIDYARKTDRSLGAIVFGGPDGTLIPYNLGRTNSLKDSSLYQSFLRLLESGYPVVLITNLGNIDKLAARFINNIPGRLRHNLTLYVASGTLKITFDHKGDMQIDKEFAAGNSMSIEDASMAQRIITEVIGERKSAYRSDLARFRKIYPTFDFEHKEPTVEMVINDEHVSEVVVYDIPSKELSNVELEGDQDDERSYILKRIGDRLTTESPGFFRRNTMRLGGASSIDIRRRYTGKDHAIVDYSQENNIHSNDLFIVGHLGVAAEDISLAFIEHEGINSPIFNNDSDTESVHIPSDLQSEAARFKSLGKGLGAVEYWIMELVDTKKSSPRSMVTPLADSTVQQIEGLFPEIITARRKAKELVKSTPWYSFSTLEKVERLEKIFNELGLSYVANVCPWLDLYEIAFARTGSFHYAFIEVKEAYRNSGDLQEFFRKVSIIYERYKDRIDELEFYAAIDPRAAKNIERIKSLGIYKTRQGFIDAMNKAARATGEPVLR